MDDDQDKKRPDANADLNQEIRNARKFTAKEALARMAGPGAMKGASPVSQVQQDETEIGTWLRGNMSDPAGALHMLLQRNLRGSEALLNNSGKPLAALSTHLRELLESDYLLAELVREADVEWGSRMDERPMFERAGVPPNPADPYTLESVRKALGEALQKLASE